DAVYVSADTAFQTSDPLLGLESREIHLDPGASAKFTKSVDLRRAWAADLAGGLPRELPGGRPRPCPATRRTNGRNNIRESSLDDNLAVSAGQMDVTVSSLAVGDSVTVALTQGQSRYFQIPAPAGKDLRISVSSSDPDATNELYLAYGRTPSP